MGTIIFRIEGIHETIVKGSKTTLKLATVY